MRCGYDHFVAPQSGSVGGGGLTLWPPAPEDDGVDGDALLTLPKGVDDGTLTRRGAESGVGVRAQC